MTPRFLTVACALAVSSVAFAVRSPAQTAGLAPIVMPPQTHPGAGQTIYVVMPDRFANGRTDNDTGHLAGEADVHGFDPTRISHYHGGDFAGLTARLPYVQELGITTIWTTPPFRNNPVQGRSAGYHGYWATDFLNIDPHLGTNEEYAAFVRAAHALGLRVYLDIVVNHTGDIIDYQGGKHGYIDKVAVPYRDADGQAFDERAVAWNGLGPSQAFPRLAAASSFPYVPVVRAGLENLKNPAWLNDVTLYHNRGNTSFQGESAVLGDFVGLDDPMTEHPRVVRGFIDIFSEWVERGVDGFRIDTMRHVNAAFWQAFNPAIRARARALGRPDFLQFGEVMNEAGDVAYLSEFSTGTMPADGITDFGFAAAARKFVAQGGPAAALADFFVRDDYYTDHDSNAHGNVTLLGNYDIGRWAYFLQQDNPGATDGQLSDLVRLGHGLLLLSRGMPALYYGDEQGMIGRGGHDQQAREDMFAATAAAYRDARLLATTRTGADDKFDPAHPFYRFFAALGRLRRDHPALRTGTTLVRATTEPGLFAFSRIERGTRVEYLAALNNSRATTLRATVATSQPAGVRFVPLFDSRTPADATGEALITEARGAVTVAIAPLHFAVWQASAALPANSSAPTVALVSPAPNAVLNFTERELDGLVFPSRREIRAEVAGGDGVGEVTFVVERASRPGQWELLGTDDAAPYRVFWTPPADLVAGDVLTIRASFDDGRGHRVADQIGGVTVAAGKTAFGIAHAECPRLTTPPPARVEIAAGKLLELAVVAAGSGELEYQWWHNDQPIPGANAARYTVAEAGPANAGSYRVSVHNLAGTTLNVGTQVVVVGDR